MLIESAARRRMLDSRPAGRPMVDETQQLDETSATPGTTGAISPATSPTTPTSNADDAGPDALRAFIASGGTFGMAVRDTLAQAQSDPTGAAA